MPEVATLHKKLLRKMQYFPSVLLALAYDPISAL
jgi:hypothetical protein